jgi:DNA repair protein RadC
MKISEIPEQNRPRERFISIGPQALSEAELLALILRTGTKDNNIIDISNKIIKEHSLPGLFECSVKELRKIKGIGTSKAIQILAIAELSKRYSSSKNPITKISSAKDVFTFFHNTLKDEKQEHFYILLLNNKNHIISQKLITKGILDSSLIHPREVFNPAIKESAARIILIHNHPSGDPSPSHDDIQTTEKLMQAGDLIDIKVLDHVIIGKDNYWSWSESQN